MKHRSLKAIALFAAMSLIPAAAQAQEGQRIQPQPISADAPTAKRALGLSTALLSGDQAKVEAYLKEHGAPAFLSSPDYKSTITALLAELKQGARVVIGQDGFEGRNDVGVGIVLSTDAGGAPTRAIVVRMETAAPHRITALRMAQIQAGD
jgi:hypothetical protein